MSEKTEQQIFDDNFGPIGEPLPPAKPIKSKNKGAGNTIKYLAIAGLVAAAGVIAYSLVF